MVDKKVQPRNLKLIQIVQNKADLNLPQKYPPYQNKTRMSATL